MAAFFPISLFYKVFSFTLSNDVKRTFSILGNMSLVAGMTATLLYGFLFKSLQPLDHYAIFRPDTYPLSFGTVAFLFCVHFLVRQCVNLGLNILQVLPIEESMREPQKWPRSLAVSVI
jgi:hypothetical protein